VELIAKLVEERGYDAVVLATRYWSADIAAVSRPASRRA